MKVWLPSIDALGGLRRYAENMATGLQASGHEVIITWLPYRWRYSPLHWRRLPIPEGTDVTIANSWNAFAVARPQTRLIACEHHLVHDPAHRLYCTSLQSAFHKLILRRFEQASFTKADYVVAVSDYVARGLEREFKFLPTAVIHNAIDCGFFRPAWHLKRPLEGRAKHLLFVGGLTRRKGVDLLGRIMQRMGSGYDLYYTTSGLQHVDFPARPNMHALALMNDAEIRTQYQAADLLLFPTRFEGFGLAAIESMACGTPVVASDCSALPELITDGVDGRLCPVGDVSAFADAIYELTSDTDELLRLGETARATVMRRFNLQRMTHAYLKLMDRMQ